MSTDAETIRVMKTCGGSFVQALGEAATRADNENLARIKAAFPEYWARYSQWADLAKADKEPTQ